MSFFVKTLFFKCPIGLIKLAVNMISSMTIDQAQTLELVVSKTNRIPLSMIPVL